MKGLKAIECTLYVALAGTIGAMAIWGAPTCAQVTVAGITLAQGLVVALR